MRYGVVTGMDAPNPDAGEEFAHVNTQLFGLIDPPGNQDILSEQMTAPFNASQDPRATATMDGSIPTHGTPQAPVARSSGCRRLTGSVAAWVSPWIVQDHLKAIFG